MFHHWSMCCPFKYGYTANCKRIEWSQWFIVIFEKFNLKVKKTWCSKYFVLSVCKISNTKYTYSGLSKNDKLTELGHEQCTFGIPKICLICLFCWAQNMRYFTLKICTLVAYRVGYIQVFVCEYVEKFSTG